MQITLRYYQQKIIDSLRNSILKGNKKIVLCSPTGSGKTVIFSFIAKEHLLRGGKILVITDRIKLLKQSSGAFNNLSLNPELIQAGKEPDLKLSIHVSMLETLYRRAERYRDFILSRTLIICDECHKSAFDKLFPFINNDCIVIGCTATPIRKGEQKSLDEFYTDIIQIIDTPELIELGFLSNAISYGVDVNLKGLKKIGEEYDMEQMGRMYNEQKVYEGVISNYNRICPNTKALLFAPNIDSAKKVHEEIKSVGLPTLLLHSDMLQTEQENVLNIFDKSKNIILTSVGILTTGADFPDVKTIILYRKIGSLALFLQICGRGSRTTLDKKEYFILDFGNNIKTHDFWEAPRTWSIAKEEKKKKIGAPAIRLCPKCGAILPLNILLCKYCGQEFIKEEKGKNELAELILLTKKEIMEIAIPSPIEHKIRLAKARLINPYWVLHTLTDKEEAKTFVKGMGYKNGFIHLNKNRFKVFN